MINKLKEPFNKLLENKQLFYHFSSPKSEPGIFLQRYVIAPWKIMTEHQKI